MHTLRIRRRKQSFGEWEIKAYQAYSFDDGISVETSDFRAIKGRKHDVHEILFIFILAQIFAIPFVLL